MFRSSRLFALPARRSPSQRKLVATSNRIGFEEIQPAIQQLASAIARRHAATPPVLLGIANGGITLARRLSALLHGAPCGVIDISFHRDDIARNPIPKEFAPTHIPVDVSGATVVLVDDVLFSGRTAKAALDELFDHGRPAKVELAVLVDRGGRRLPVAADYCGLTLKAGDTERVSVRLDPDDPANDSIRVLPAEQMSTPPVADRRG
jgi:pyrimidine operon attenuation protein/uracil phosphoribosyltransferase